MWECVKVAAHLEDCVSQERHISTEDQVWRRMESLLLPWSLIAAAVLFINS